MLLIYEGILTVPLDALNKAWCEQIFTGLRLMILSLHDSCIHFLLRISVMNTGRGHMVHLGFSNPGKILFDVNDGICT